MRCAAYLTLEKHLNADMERFTLEIVGLNRIAVDGGGLSLKMMMVVVSDIDRSVC